MRRNETLLAVTGPLERTTSACWLQEKGSVMERPETIKMLIGVPLDLKRWIEAQAARNVSPQSSEIIRILCARMETEQRAAG
jgi:hypothetical protein